MKCKLVGKFLGLLAVLLSAFASAAPPENCRSVLDYSAPGLLSGKPQSLCEYSGKVVLLAFMVTT